MLLSGYDPVMYSRILTSFTLAFHIIYATIGVGVPLDDRTRGVDRYQTQ